MLGRRTTTGAIPISDSPGRAASITATHDEVTDDVQIQIEFNSLPVWTGHPAEARTLLARPDLYDYLASRVQDALDERKNQEQRRAE